MQVIIHLAMRDLSLSQIHIVSLQQLTSLLYDYIFFVYQTPTIDMYLCIAVYKIRVHVYFCNFWAYMLVIDRYSQEICRNFTHHFRVHTIIVFIVTMSAENAKTLIVL